MDNINPTLDFLDRQAIGHGHGVRAALSGYCRTSLPFHDTAGPRRLNRDGHHQPELAFARVGHLCLLCPDSGLFHFQIKPAVDRLISMLARRTKTARKPAPRALARQASESE